MRIVFLMPAPPWKPVGGFRVIYEYANQLVARGHHVCVVHPSRMRNTPVTTGAKGYVRKIGGYLYNRAAQPRIRWLSLDRRVDLRYVWEPVAHVVPDADCIFATAWQTSEYVHEYPASKGRKYYLVMDFPPWFASEAVLTQTWRLPMRKIAICGWLQGLVQAATGLEAVSIPLGIDHDRFRITVPPVDRQDYVAMMYSTAGYKDVATGIAALEHVRRQGANVSAVLFGPIGRRPAALPGWMDYRGTLSDSELVRLYNTTAVFVCSSIAEGFALPPAEAMACGCAIATTDCGGNRDYARHEQNALVCHPRDPRALGDHVLRLLRDRELRLRLAGAGAETMRAFTWERSTELLLEELHAPHPAGVA